MAIIAMVFADQIYIYGPPSNGIYHPKDVMDIRYHGKFFFFLARHVGLTNIQFALLA